MLCNKLITLSISRIVQVRKFHNSVIHSLTRKHISYSSLMQLPVCQNNSNDLNIENYRTPPALYRCLNNIDPIFRKKVLKHYLLMKGNNIDPYLINDNISNEFALLIKDDLLENMCHVIELNPGYGLLTKRLLEAGVSFIHLYECRDIFYQELQSLKAIFPNRVNITRVNLVKMLKMVNSSKKYDTPNVHVCELFNKVPNRKWEEKCHMQVIGTVTKYTFMRHLILSVLFQTSFMMHGRTTFYLAVSPSIWDKLTCSSKKRSSSNIMFNVLFNFTMFGALDRQGFLPQKQMKKSKIKSAILNEDIQLFYVVKLEPKSDLLSLFGGREQLIYFWHFIRQNLYRPSLRIIPTMEKVIPGFGKRLIEKDYTIFTQFSELSIDEIIRIFIELKSHPQFNESSFLTSGDDIRRIYDPYMEGE